LFNFILLSYFSRIFSTFLNIVDLLKILDTLRHFMRLSLIL
jgi:hypothetical protein